MPAATSTTGFFQVEPQLPNAWDEDATLRRAADLFLPSSTLKAESADLHSFAADVISPEIFAAITNAETQLPYLNGGGYTAFGAPQDAATLVTSPGWNILQDFALASGFVPQAYDAKLGGSARVVEALKIALWAPSSALTTCPSGMQDGAIEVLRTQLKNNTTPPGWTKDLQDTRTKVFEAALARLMNTNPREAWTSGQWMTERAGGSDVRGTETIAEWVGMGADGVDLNGLPLGPYSISGFKWFASAADCGVSILLAFTPKGLSCFLAPTRKLVNGKVKINGFRFQRLKNKLGTKALPSAELEIKGMRAWLIGEEGRGVAVISTVLNVTRLHNAIRTAGFMGRGLSVVRAFARVRTFPSRPAPNNYLYHIPLFNKTLANLTVRYRADMLVATFIAGLLGAVSTNQRTVAVLPSSHEDNVLLLRLLTSVAKAYTTKHGVAHLQECMEGLGGVGYLENNETPHLNVARMFRDANVFPIWEGTFDVLSTDTVKVLRGKLGGECEAALGRWIKQVLSAGSSAQLSPAKQAVQARWDAFARSLPSDKDTLMPHARYVVNTIGDIVAATLLVADAERDGNEVAAEIARRFITQQFAPDDVKPVFGQTAGVSRMDQLIAFEGDNEVLGKTQRAKL
ncbi:hypothetical protein VHUM_03247 [Vanrija humicola]|uniref:Acyl-CoA dehydrogenase/oxidase C-terminal domain-containing protein n=1 Tax=Vanrija humicola TaxID=5417 RepID=A0A7D8Z4K6_VANHU|nr:hypothetical protein VHUM_03247 [Vanrija humicola]